MSFAGHVMQMIRSNEQTAAMKRARREKLKRVRDAYSKSPWTKVKIRKRKKLSEAELNIIKAKNKHTAIKERRILFVKTFLVSTIVIAAIAYLIYLGLS